MEQKVGPDNSRSPMSESEGIQQNIYSLSNDLNMVEVNPHQVRYIQSGPDRNSTKIHFGPGDFIIVAMPFEQVSADLGHVFGRIVKLDGKA
ncbi:hypothetical protein R1A27_06405 [Methylobacterium sp. NMS12]|uniref:hypothetical protein n=1 Tax=Methylobacterium sp. NMS12 TaxID=3079766 RepID=UPI003F883477